MIEIEQMLGEVGSAILFVAMNIGLFFGVMLLVIVVATPRKIKINKGKRFIDNVNKSIVNHERNTR